MPGPLKSKKPLQIIHPHNHKGNEVNPAAWMFLGVTLAFIFWRAIRRWRFHMPDDAHFCWRCRRFGRIRMDGYMTCLNCGYSEWSCKHWADPARASDAAAQTADQDKTKPNLKIVK